MNTLLENATNFQLTCTVIDGNPMDSTYRWFRNGSLISTTAIFTISKVKTNDAGSYKCDSSNIIGVSDQSAEIHLNVLCKFMIVNQKHQKEKKNNFQNLNQFSLVK